MRSRGDATVKVYILHCCKNGRLPPRDSFSDELEKTNYLRTIDMTNVRVHYLIDFLTTWFMTPTMFPFNRLPVELQREIFVMAASSERGSALRLVLVARRTRLWVQSYIYDMVTLGSGDTKLFLRTMDTVPPGFLANCVKKLCLSVSVSAYNAERILNVCAGVVDLAFWVDYLRILPTRPIAPFLSPLPLHRLSIEINHLISLFSNPDCQPRWASSLTHLDVVLWSVQTSYTIPPLVQLLSLTHLAVRPRHNLVDDFSITTILSACKKLQVFVIYDEFHDVDEVVWAEDPRVVFMSCPSKIISQWEEQARREDGCSWSRAEELVRKSGAEREAQGSTA